MQIDDRLPDDLVIRNVEINVVVGAQAGGAPVDLHDFGEAIAHLQPVAHFVGPADLQRDAGNNSAEKILSGKAEDDGRDAGAGEKALELGFSVINEAEDEKQRDEENEESNHLAQEMRNGRLPLLFEIIIPEVTIDESDHHDGAHENKHGADVLPKLQRHAVGPDRRVKGCGDAEQLEQHTQPHARPALQERPIESVKKKVTKKIEATVTAALCVSSKVVNMLLA